MHLKSDYTRYLRYEKITVLLTVRNYSGNTMLFSSKDAKIFFKIQHTNTGMPAKCLDLQANPAQSLILGPGQSKELNITLNSIYNMQKEGVYEITAYLNHPRSSRTHVSNTIDIEVRSGSPILGKTIGLPSNSNNGIIKSVNVILMLFTDVNSKIYCLRVEDEDNIYATLRLGPYISGTHPQLDVDGTSSIHILIQVAPRLYSYLTYSFIGRNLKLRQQRYYIPENGSPELERKKGFLHITHAKIAELGTDYELLKEQPKQ